MKFNLRQFNPETGETTEKEIEVTGDEPLDLILCADFDEQGNCTDAKMIPGIFAFSLTPHKTQ